MSAGTDGGNYARCRCRALHSRGQAACGGSTRPRSGRGHAGGCGQHAGGGGRGPAGGCAVRADGRAVRCARRRRGCCPCAGAGWGALVCLGCVARHGCRSLPACWCWPSLQQLTAWAMLHTGAAQVGGAMPVVCPRQAVMTGSFWASTSCPRLSVRPASHTAFVCSPGLPMNHRCNSALVVHERLHGT